MHSRLLKRIALPGAIAALTILGPPDATAQGWGGPFGYPCCGGPYGVTVHVDFPLPPPPPPPPPVFRRPIACCYHPLPPPPPPPPPPCCCCGPGPAGFFPHRHPLYFYGDRFVPYGYNWRSDYHGW